MAVFQANFNVRFTKTASLSVGFGQAHALKLPLRWYKQASVTDPFSFLSLEHAEQLLELLDGDVVGGEDGQHVHRKFCK